MAATIRFTMPRGTGVADLPEALRLLVEPTSNGTVAIRSEAPLHHLRHLSDWASGRGFDLRDVEVRRPSLEDVYLQLIGSPA
jgi:hypothetical protein